MNSLGLRREKSIDPTINAHKFSIRAARIGTVRDMYKGRKETHREQPRRGVIPTSEVENARADVTAIFNAPILALPLVSSRGWGR